MDDGELGTRGGSPVALVTGADVGIGRATAAALLDRGMTVWVTSRHVDALADHESRGAHGAFLDLCDETSIRTLCEQIHKVHGGLDVIVNNAGYGLLGAVEELDPDDVRRQFETNVVGPLLLTQRFLPGMRERRSGRIVNVGSVAGHMWLPGHAAYHASKHALRVFTDTLRYEVAGFGIEVVAVEPGAVRTEWAQRALAGLDAPARGDGPYSGLARAVETQIRRSHSGLLGATAASPESCARVIVRAATAERPRRTYRVPLQAKVVIGAQRWMPAGVWEMFLRRLYGGGP